MPTLPMLTLTTTGGRAASRATPQLAYHADGGDFLVVASAMGQERHPDWSYNLLATPDAAVQLRGERRLHVRAELLGDAEKRRVWPDVKRTIHADERLRAAHVAQHPCLPPQADRGNRRRRPFARARIAACSRSSARKYFEG
ncbi:MAG: nitroreductase/quinone reductase family protein [Candidatus Binatia bacterium]